MSDLLFEIGTEEIPAGYLNPALKQLEQKFVQYANEQNLKYEAIKTLGTPRRLILSVKGLIECQEDKLEEIMGPSKAAGFDQDGNATKAAMGFAKSKGADVADLQVVETDKGEYLMLRREVKGKETKELLPEILLSLIDDISFPKSMIWGGHTKHFARPVQWLLALFGDTVIPISYTGLQSSNLTRGHRFLANISEEVKTADLDTFEQQLENLAVIADFDKRRSMVVEEVKGAVSQLQDGVDATAAIDDKLVDIVTNLVEKPFAVCGSYEEKFLQLPAEVLITSMREHQKYFPVIDADGKLKAAFIAVNNTEVKDIAITRKGHQRVLRARLEDAFFFFESDKEVKLESRIDKLKGIIFQAKLGTMEEKVDRIVQLSSSLAELLAKEKTESCKRAALLSKADLLTDMVGEFPSLQGTMGGSYALNDGELPEVAEAIEQHYMPLRAGAPVPESDVARIVGLADRFDTLTGCFGIGQVPTGTADPFGLRRISLAILQIIRAGKYTLSIKDVVQNALALYGDKVDTSRETVEKIMFFIQQRFVNDLVASGYDQQSVDAGVSVGFDDVNDVIARIDSLAEIKKEEAFPILAASFKRIRNISKDNDATAVKEELFEQDEEKSLFEAFRQVDKRVSVLLQEKNYPEALIAMLNLKEPVDTFFDKVMVMSENEAVKQNRLNMLTALNRMVLQIGDISRMQDN